MYIGWADSAKGWAYNKATLSACLIIYMVYTIYLELIDSLRKFVVIQYYRNATFMMKRVNKKRKYYVLMEKSCKKARIFTTKQGVADAIGVNRATIGRWMEKTTVYENEGYIIWCDVPVIYRK